MRHIIPTTNHQLTSLNNATTTTQRMQCHAIMHVVPTELQLPSLMPFSRQTKTTGKITQLPTTFMFTPKTNSKQKRVKQTQERETGQAATEQFARRVLTLVVATSHLNYSPWRPSHSSWRARTGSSRELNIFHPKIPILTSQCPNLIPKLV
ncbi:hypothetical protein MTR_4g040380 [Medicago truncatula]|uniref:Uncharacterized protein n=1 Tax=Medicago truncatula TaxID=3880 RepID=A0A072UIL4_MEDTR|nr:hypothetical protein MTR_4g040380 [Medicago truncatula]